MTKTKTKTNTKTKTLLAGLLLAGATVLLVPPGAADAAPIRPVENAAAAAAGNLVQAHYRYDHRRHRHCWWRHGHRHCGWW
ncbi:MAG TPA: hypothetical protein VFB29_11940 [Pseudolabrys sp.]|nr:hypothetical protein [Pseudolabrys sp.]